jgi:hypothetical protein
MLRLTNKVDVGPGASVQAGKEQGRRTHQTHPTSHYTTIIVSSGKQSTHIHTTQRQRKRWREGAGRNNKVLCPACVLTHKWMYTLGAASERKIRRCVYMVCGSQAQLPDAHRAVRALPMQRSHSRLPCPHSGAKIDWSAADRTMHHAGGTAVQWIF